MAAATNPYQRMSYQELLAVYERANRAEKEAIEPLLLQKIGQLFSERVTTGTASPIEASIADAIARGHVISVPAESSGTVLPPGVFLNGTATIDGEEYDVEVMTPEKYLEDSKKEDTVRMAYIKTLLERDDFDAALREVHDLWLPESVDEALSTMIQRYSCKGDIDAARALVSKLSADKQEDALELISGYDVD